MAKKALIIDGNSVIYRAFYATFHQLEYYKIHNMQPVNVVKLVLLIYLRLISSEKYDYVLFAIDMGKKTFRHDESAEYKANRKPMPEDLVSQLPLIKQALTDIGVTVYGQEGIEADDIIGSVAYLLNKQGTEVEIVSSDRDLLQLVNNLTSVLLVKSGFQNIEKITPSSFQQLYPQLEPSQICDYKGISGDSSDNLKGVKGVGPKLTITLLEKYRTLENIFNHLNELSESLQQKFSVNRERALLCKRLCTIKIDALNPSFILDSIINRGINTPKLEEIVNKYHFSGFQKYLHQTE